MGEAKRRKTLDPNYGKSNMVENARRCIKNAFLEQRNLEETDQLYILFTNKDRGCTPEQIEELKKEIPKRYQSKKFNLMILPQEYAHLPPEKALAHFVYININTD